MNDKQNMYKPDYLWDPSEAVVDIEVQRVERTLRGHRFDADAATMHVDGEFAHSGDTHAVVNNVVGGRRQRGAVRAVLAIAALIVICGMAWRAFVMNPPTTNPEPTWIVKAIQGVTQIGGIPISSRSDSAQQEMAAVGTGEWRIDQWLITDARSRAEIEVADLGYIEVEPESRVRLKASGEAQHRIQLARGKLRVFISAPPRLFVVETPEATAIDLGCIYTLEVREDGGGELFVKLGWVELERGSRTSIVPSGAVCKMARKLGPGTPYFADASDSFKEALAQFDFDPAITRVPETLFAEVRPRDSLTLWHLLPVVESQQDRSRVYDRLAQLSAPPAGVTREGVVENLDDQMLSKWWRSLKRTW